MSQIIAGIIGFIIGAVVAYLLTKGKMSGDTVSAGAKVAERSEDKSENKKKTLGLFDSQEKVTNDDVEKALKVSDATAERYLNELEKEGLISQVGETGQAVYYVKK